MGNDRPRSRRIVEGCRQFHTSSMTIALSHREVRQNDRQIKTMIILPSVSINTDSNELHFIALKAITKGKLLIKHCRIEDGLCLK